ncbi:MAG: 50S ribosomal protein L23 [Candidatus Harrisonbacteria bacterium CG10_big_fil_rev_8_21_14_0_10_42_17]|uniref:Large ribosomal subunit protein uL23 n=1 Tax=Candidatus Harrisonbacteria bacterium CG10_big_fil_rev_8_21_14_0_10_42_17 TaxID=1974584 RepID=A0A2M6WHK4_9BACT|nr:MAG: 50S ribosomal protein L23 [Candidatus Harrisonbacteria bacterium CG10_big_fil_rev_8_21_14_0_10_42_17]
MSHFLIKHPLISEKSTLLSSLGKYVFIVDGRATAPEIKKAMKKLYEVDVVNVNLITVKSKKRRLGRTLGKKPGYKKAILTLKEGQKLDVLPHT